MLEANLSGANLSAADLSSASLAYADLSFADLGHANLSSTSLQDAELTCSDFRSAKNVKPEVLKSAKHWDKAFYDDAMLKALGLPPDHNAKLVAEPGSANTGVPPKERRCAAAAVPPTGLNGPSSNLFWNSQYFTSTIFGHSEPLFQRKDSRNQKAAGRSGNHSIHSDNHPMQCPEALLSVDQWGAETRPVSVDARSSSGYSRV